MALNRQRKTCRKYLGTRTVSAFLALALTGTAPLLRGAESLDADVRVSVSEARFHFTARDGQELPLSASIGAKLVVRTDDGSKATIRIDGAEQDPRDKSGEVILYQFSVLDAASGTWQPYCEPDPDGRRAGFPLAASQMGGETREGGFFITCTGGAYGKCIRFGYSPWRSENGMALYQSCVRMVRADYCGDGVGHTRNGTPINIYDPQGIQKRDDVPGMIFEAGWSPNGAVCVNKTRLPDVLTLEKLRADCPRLRPEGELAVCNETSALAHGAQIFNESH